MNKVGGLCGYYNGDPGDDLKTEDGTVVTSAGHFGNSWRKADLAGAHILMSHIY